MNGRWLALGAAVLASAAVLMGGGMAFFSDSAAIDGNTFTADTLGPPTGLSGTGCAPSASIALNWTATADTYASGHRVLRGTATGGPYAQIAEVTPRTTTTYTDSPVAGTYFYRLRSFYQNWESVDSSEESASVAEISLRAATSAGAPSGTLTLTIATPGGTVSGDVMVASIAVRPNTATITPPAGWTLLRRMDNASATASSLAVYYRVAGGSEPANYSWTFSASTGSAGGIQTFSGVNTTTPIDVENGQSTASGLSHTTPSVTTTVANTMLVTSHGFSSAATWTPPGGMTEAFDVASIAAPNAAGISIEGNCALQAAAGATGAKTATASANSDVGNAHILALQPAP